MPFRAVIYNQDKSISLIFPKFFGNWFFYRKGAYYLDLNAVCQVLDKGAKIKALREAVYIEGNPIPIRSNVNIEDISKENFQSKVDTAQNKPAVSFWDKLRGK